MPLFTSCVLPALSTETQFIVIYLLVSMVVTDLMYLPRLNHRFSPSALVTVLDALGKYHDFTWDVCRNMTVRHERLLLFKITTKTLSMQTFHNELLKRSRNQPGFLFVKLRSYEIQYNGHILQQEDWEAIEPFTTLFVDFIITQVETTAVKCPWCKTVSLASEGSTDVMWYVFSLFWSKLWNLPIDRLARALSVLDISQWWTHCKPGLMRRSPSMIFESRKFRFLKRFWEYESSAKFMIHFVNLFELISWSRTTTQSELTMESITPTALSSPQTMSTINGSDPELTKSHNREVPIDHWGDVVSYMFMILDSSRCRKCTRTLEEWSNDRRGSGGKEKTAVGKWSSWHP